MLLKMAAFITLIALPADAAVLRYYTPGGSPCDGACSYEWAVEEFQVPEGEIKRMIIPEGSIVNKMSYAKDGTAYWTSDSAILASEQYGEGYSFEQNGRTYMMVKLDECDNWSVMTPPVPGITLNPPPPVMATLPPILFLPPIITTTYDPPFYDPPTYDPPVWEPPVEEPPCCTQPPIVPLPASLLLMLSALGGILLLKTRQI